MAARQDKIRFLLVEGQALVREALAHAFAGSEEFEMVGQCSHGGEAMALSIDHSPDVVLLGHDDRNGVTTRFLSELGKAPPSASVLVMASSLNTAEVRRLVRLNVGGIISRERSLDELCEAMRAVAARRSWFEQQHLVTVVRPAAGRALVSGRDKVVLRCLAEGMANKAIAHELGITEPQVRVTIRQLFKKAGVRTRAQLLGVAMEKKWV